LVINYLLNANLSFRRTPNGSFSSSGIWRFSVVIVLELGCCLLSSLGAKQELNDEIDLERPRFYSCID